MKKSLFITFLFMPFLFGCGNKNYQNINNIKKNYNIVKGDNSIILRHKNFNPSNFIFDELDKVMSDDFIYIYSWVNHLPTAGTNHFKGLIYDRKSKKQFYIFNTLENTKSINIDEDTESFKEEILILNYYLENNLDVLISLSPAFSSSEVGSEFYLFDSLSKEAFVVKNLVLNNDGEIFK